MLALLAGTGFLVGKVIQIVFFGNSKPAPVIDDKPSGGNPTAYTDAELKNFKEILPAEDYDLIVTMKYLPELPKLINADFNIDLLPRYIMAIRNRGVAADKAVEYVNANEDYIPESQLDWGSFYKNIKEIPMKDASSYTVMVNKQNRLPSNYIPSDLKDVPSPYYGTYDDMPLREEALKALMALSDASVEAGYDRIYGQSNYRSYDLQKDLYGRYSSTEVADKESARPGHSEHQTGLVADVGGGRYMMEEFIYYAGYDWTLAHMHEYGFIQSYPKNKEFITGYEFESWHLRYVGKELATLLYAHNWTLEEYYTVFD